MAEFYYSTQITFFMSKESLFIVIEGLDGSGKTSVARQLAYFLQSALKKNVKLTFEPHDPSCGGLFIRQVLEKKIRDFSHETLMLAFAANRLDHCDREINEWLSDGDDRIIICDRYYLSSLVYQSNKEFSFDHVMGLNHSARKPDITIFMNVSNKVCYERMKIRNKPKELFERDLTKTREKYFEAIDFLREVRNENIVIVDASGTISEVLTEVVKRVSEMGPDYREAQLSLIKTYNIPRPNVFSLNGNIPSTLDSIIEEILSFCKNKDELVQFDKNKIYGIVNSKFNSLEFNQKGALFFNYIKSLGFKVGEKFPWTHLDAYELEYDLPGGLVQRGTVLLINENQRYDVIIGSVSNLTKMTDFMFVFSPGPSELVTKYYERDIIKYKNKEESLFPSTQLITENNLQDVVFEKVLQQLSKNLHV